VAQTPPTDRALNRDVSLQHPFPGIPLPDAQRPNRKTGSPDKHSRRDRFDAAFSPDSKMLALAGGRRVGKDHDVGEVKLWNLLTNEISALFQRSRYVFSAAFSPDGGRLGAVVDGRTVVVWDLTAKKELTVIERRIGSSSDQVFFLPGGDEIAFTTAAPSRIEFWKIVR
jgi:WD40 repeat protein